MRKTTPKNKKPVTRKAAKPTKPLQEQAPEAAAAAKQVGNYLLTLGEEIETSFSKPEPKPTPEPKPKSDLFTRIVTDKKSGLLILVFLNAPVRRIDKAANYHQLVKITTNVNGVYFEESVIFQKYDTALEFIADFSPKQAANFCSSVISEANSLKNSNPFEFVVSHHKHSSDGIHPDPTCSSRPFIYDTNSKTAGMFTNTDSKKSD